MAKVLAVVLAACLAGLPVLSWTADCDRANPARAPAELRLLNDRIREAELEPGFDPGELRELKSARDRVLAKHLKGVCPPNRMADRGTLAAELHW